MGCDCHLATLGSFVFEFAFHEPGRMGEWHTSKLWSHGSGVAPCLTLPPPPPSGMEPQPPPSTRLTESLPGFTDSPHPAAICQHLLPKAHLAGSRTPDTGTWCIASHHVPWHIPCAFNYAVL